MSNPQLALCVLLIASLAFLGIWMLGSAEQNVLIRACQTSTDWVVTLHKVQALSDKLAALKAAELALVAVIAGIGGIGLWQSNRLKRQAKKAAGDQLAAELSDLKRRQRLLIEEAVDVICVVDVRGNIVSLSASSETAWGYRPDELQGKPLVRVLESQESENVLETVVGAANSIDKVVFESQLRRKDGTVIDVVWTGHWSASEGGLFLIVHDISHQKQIEKNIRESEHRLRVSLESLPIGVLAAGGSGDIEFANIFAHKLLRFHPGDLVGKQIDSVFDGLTLDDVIAKSANEGIETFAVRQDATLLPIELFGRNIELADQPKELLVFYDKSAQLELERMKKEFIAMVTHDLRSPLTTFQGMLTLLDKELIGKLTEEGRGMSQRMHRECDRLVRLLNDMLQLESIDANSFQLQCADVDMRRLLEDAVANVSQLAETKHISLNSRIHHTMCFADEQRIMQVLTNLLTNAIKYSPEKSSITVAIEDQADMALVSVEDQGAGIPPDKVDQLFKKFSRLGLEDAKKAGGTGLGLAICKSIIAEHGGDIGVEPANGRGSRFWFTLPKANRT
jgi:PAS domain S-box-containing protein